MNQTRLIQKFIPLFFDWTKDDYRLKADSPALKLGFVPIETTKIGPRNGWESSWNSK